MRKLNERARAIEVLKEIGELGVTTGDLERLEWCREVRQNDDTKNEANDERKS